MYNVNIIFLNTNIRILLLKVDEQNCEGDEGDNIILILQK